MKNLYALKNLLVCQRVLSSQNIRSHFCGCLAQAFTTWLLSFRHWRGLEWNSIISWCQVLHLKTKQPLPLRVRVCVCVSAFSKQLFMNNLQTYLKRKKRKVLLQPPTAKMNFHFAPLLKPKGGRYTTIKNTSKTCEHLPKTVQLYPCSLRTACFC